MKKVFSIFLVFIICIGTLVGSSNKGCIDAQLVTLVGSTNEGCLEAQLVSLNYDEIKDKLIRFHVIANSDSDEDQAVKLLVRDEVIDYINLQLKDATGKDEARDILKDNIEEVNNIAVNILRENGFDYEANTMISNENFPDKVYGDYLFPQGNYEAFRIIIGNGEGHNWWCVMFPPLCFVDETKGDVDSKELEKELIGNNHERSYNSNIEYKFKIVEVIKDILKNN